jgi:hypothetical protein
VEEEEGMRLEEEDSSWSPLSSGAGFATGGEDAIGVEECHGCRINYSTGLPLSPHFYIPYVKQVVNSIEVVKIFPAKRHRLL